MRAAVIIAAFSAALASATPFSTRSEAATALSLPDCKELSDCFTALGPTNTDCLKATLSIATGAVSLTAISSIIELAKCAKDLSVIAVNPPASCAKCIVNIADEVEKGTGAIQSALGSIFKKKGGN